MHLKRYEVVDMAEAISQIKRDLGPDAIILSTRTIHKRGGIFRPVDKPLLEVIAAADPRESQGPDPTGSVVSRDAGLVDPALAPPPAFSLELPPMPSATAEIEVLGREVQLMRAELQATPVIVAADREEFSQALRQTRDFEAIFIDTAGRCHCNTEQMWELQALPSHPWPIEAHLVLSATTREEEAEEMIRQFSVIPLQSPLFTQLDGSSSLGSLFNFAVRTTKPLSYLTTGQRVPEDFEVATPERIVDLCWHGFWR